MQYVWMAGAGNLFAVVDGFRVPLPEDPPRAAREICESRVRGGKVPDGLILVRPSSKGADCAMEIYNADGSRAETCGNGLRCVAKLVADRGHVASGRFVIETDAGMRATEVERIAGSVARARVHMGAPRSITLDERIELSTAEAQDARVPRAPQVHRATLVDMGNPHCVLFVDRVETAPVSIVGPALERHPRFPNGTNVEFVTSLADGIRVRVWERGVGETRACGSGACAAALATVARGLGTWPMNVEMPGGVLEVDRDDQGLILTGPVEEWAADRARGLGA
jgi:diaminopimelate epimerase